ncbi:hypothetical protein [Halodesulfovibrio marinisediminis]|uniref:Uncharacterized protein n=1 Tax=Halodesulfovibrio marinisediminis DSM 17456 TaxID=1121457 RepID=A0A1N6DY48_9BACT|nr:hypothetical protein [Halodesulfovibrio marinisediminis]SIN75663.1 hypothetical protein SAMN02745161_0568 [Halodesulfovibrio marinisediminis DSM 17456]
MFENSFFPEWLDAFVVEDERFGAAYDAVPDNRRAWLKTTIARLHVLYGTPQVMWGRQENHWRQGHISVAETRPVDWAVVVVDSSYASGVRLLAAAMMPLLSGVEDILVMFSGEKPVAAECLAALELAGIEMAVQLDADNTSAFMTEISSAGTSGRVLALGNVARQAVHNVGVLGNGLSAWFEPQYSSLGVLAGGSFDRDLLAWAHPDLNIVEVAEDDLGSLSSLAAVCCEADVVDAVADTVPVSLGAGQEGCWIWPDLLPQWFMHRRFSLLSEV